MEVYLNSFYFYLNIIIGEGVHKVSKNLRAVSIF